MRRVWDTILKIRREARLRYLHYPSPHRIAGYVWAQGMSKCARNLEAEMAVDF